MSGGSGNGGRGSGVGLFLPGGGAAGAMYQIGVLAALEDAGLGIHANRFDLFLGASSGASVAAALAGGIEVRRIYRALLDPADAYFPLERAHILKMDLREWGRASRTALSALRQGMASAFTRAPGPTPAALWEELDRLYDSLPAGLFSLERYERFFADRLVRRGVPNSFAALPRPLRVIAHDLDSGERLVFGSAGYEHVPVTRACTASMALPPFFSPVRVGERLCIDAGSAQVSVLDVPERACLRSLLVINPMVPVKLDSVPTGHGERSSLRDKGAMWVANQAHRISLHALLEQTIAGFKRATGAEVVLIEPDPTDTLLFMYNPASFSTRRAVLENAYRSTRERVARWSLERIALSERPPGIAL
jgi:predicted acylesterase/phospholipase RssA